MVEVSDIWLPELWKVALWLVGSLAVAVLLGIVIGIAGKDVG